MKKLSDLRQFKNKKKITVLTAYDYAFAKAAEAAEIDALLVGDSLGMVVYGHPNTKNVTMDMMLRHVEAVRKGAEKTIVVADMPLGSYDTPELALKNAKAFLGAGASAVKIEGYGEGVAITQELTSQGIEVMGHLGLLPQVAQSFSIQGKSDEEAEAIISSSLEYEKAGMVALVLECIPAALADKITKQLSVPTIGIGAGRMTDGQILVSYDLVGLYPNKKLKFARKLNNFYEQIVANVKDYKQLIEKGDFPSDEESF